MHPNAYSRVSSPLERNFRELYHAITSPSKESPALVANFSATKIYDSRYIWGHLWRRFYQVVDWITGGSLHLEKLKQAMLNTSTLFHREIYKTENSLKEYLEYLEKNGKGYNVAEANYFPARRRITEWNSATKPFLKLLEKQPLDEFLLKQLKIETTEPLFNSIHTPIFHACQKIIDLEGLTGAPLPLASLKKIIKNKPLNSIDQKDLDQWIYKIDKKDLKVTSVYKGLGALAKLYKNHKEHGDNNENLSGLLVFLEDKGCKTFQKSEAKHLAWRQRLQPGEKFTLNATEIILGSELYPLSFGSDKTRAYHIQGYSDRIALIAQNRISLAMRDLKMRRQTNFGIAPALLQDISADGRIATIERLQALTTIKWTSAKNEVSSQDEPLINVLAHLVQTFIKSKITPSNFSADNVMFNERFELKSLKPLIKGPFDFNALEDFMIECASGNLTVFQQLMTKSGLLSHGTATFYRDLISSNFFEEHEAPDDLAGIYRISDPKVVDRGILLIKQIDSIKKQIYPRLRELFPKETPEQVEKKVKEILLKHYIQHKSAGVLWPAFAEHLNRRF